MLRRAAFTLVVLSCLAAAPDPGVSARQQPEKHPQGNVSPVKEEAVGLLVSRLNGVSESLQPLGITTWVNRVRAEGCVLSYTVISDHITPRGPDYSRLPQVSGEDRTRRVYEWTVDLADLDPAAVRVWNPLGKKKGGTVTFRTAGGRQSVSRKWPQNTRAGVRMRTDRLRAGSFSSDDEAPLEEIAAAMRRAIEVCKSAPQ